MGSLFINNQEWYIFVVWSINKKGKRKIQQEKLNVVAFLGANPHELDSTLWQNIPDYNPTLERHLHKPIIK